MSTQYDTVSWLRLSGTFCRCARQAVAVSSGAELGAKHNVTAHRINLSKNRAATAARGGAVEESRSGCRQSVACGALPELRRFDTMLGLLSLLLTATAAAAGLPTRKQPRSRSAGG